MTSLRTDTIHDLSVRYSPRDTTYKNFVVLVHGGSKHVGKDRFMQLQEDLSVEGIGSLSFDFPGVGDSRGDMAQSTLNTRIADTEHILQFVTENFSFDSLGIYGVSMGGYITLSPDITKFVQKIIVHAPAAYASSAIDVVFDDTFTSILRAPDSWRDSHSFRWVEQETRPILLLINELDTVVPEIITTKYLERLNPHSSHMKILGAAHNVWTDIDTDKKVAMTTSAIITFLENN